jgi:hypothetical protein
MTNRPVPTVEPVTSSECSPSLAFPADAAPGTIRKQLAESLAANTVHGSVSDENAAIEIACFFKGDEIVG